MPEPLPFTTGTQLRTEGHPGGDAQPRHTQAQQDLHEVWDFENNRPLEGADPKKVAEVEKLLPEEGRWLTDREGNEVWVGRTSLQQKDARMTRFMETLDPDQQELFRRWYERVLGLRRLPVRPREDEDVRATPSSPRRRHSHRQAGS